MTKPATYFNVKPTEMLGHTRYVVSGEHGELRSTFSTRQEAKLFCAQLNAAFALGQTELLKDQGEKS